MAGKLIQLSTRKSSNRVYIYTENSFAINGRTRLKKNRILVN